ncbi:MAG: hypothetical protein OHK0013_09010 [Sandaracinaceae bacterium]
MSLILDAGALLALERGDREVLAMLKSELALGRVPRTHGGVVGQVWRGGTGKGARLAQVLPGLRILPLDEALGRRAGLLLARARTSDVVDAALVLLAVDGDTILTSDPEDLAKLAAAADLHVDVVRV